MVNYQQTTGKLYEGKNLQCTNSKCGKVFRVSEQHLAQGMKTCIYCGCQNCEPFKQTTASLPKQENKDG